MMVLPANDYNKCPAFDRELKRCAHAYPDLNNVFFGEQRSCKGLVSALATLNEVMLPVDEKEDVQIQYVFSEDDIVKIIDSYKEETWNIEDLNTIITDSRECFQREHSYINNVFRKWKHYEIPAVENGYYQIREPGIFRVIETVNEKKDKIYQLQRMSVHQLQMMSVHQLQMMFAGLLLYYAGLANL